MNDTHFHISFFFFFFYSTSDFRIHIIRLKIFTYEQHGEHQGLFSTLKKKKFGPHLFLVQLSRVILCEHVVIYNQRCSYFLSVRFKFHSRRNDSAFESVTKQLLVPQKTNTIDCIITVFLSSYPR